MTMNPKIVLSISLKYRKVLQIKHINEIYTIYLLCKISYIYLTKPTALDLGFMCSRCYGGPIRIQSKTFNVGHVVTAAKTSNPSYSRLITDFPGHTEHKDT
jgi:hypothetical protein